MYIRDNEAMAWDLEGYWANVLELDRNPQVIVTQFELDPSDSPTMDAWMRAAELEAWGDESTPETWAEFHAQALNEIMAAT